MTSDRSRIVVTGMGAMTPLGQTSDAFWANLVAGKPGIGPMTLCDPTDYPCRIAGEVRDFDPAEYMDNKESRRMARFSPRCNLGSGSFFDRRPRNDGGRPRPYLPAEGAPVG